MGKSIDVRRLIKSKNPKLLNWLPGFIIRWIERVIHQDEANAFFEKHQNSDEYAFCEGALNHFNLRFTIEGEENIPPHPNKVIFASNHPLGGMDAISIIYLLKENRRDIKFIVNDLLMAVYPLKDRFVGVNKVGRNAALSLQKVEEQFANGTATFIFPAGLVSRKIKGKIIDLEWKKTFITKAKKYEIPVLPVHIGGQLTNRFYRLANFRKFLGIKLNFEMLFLVDELFRQKNMKINIIVGKPIAPDTFNKSRSDNEWAKWVKGQVYSLPSSSKA
ncbi:MAG: 1-acyl-sn-glycerol-3-phosphate acyltransferase [Ekhidna sp.]|nr:1-acyl-sn-glycerol-3-phosphate acyltransferase [Ekhidna sp.]